MLETSIRPQQGPFGYSTLVALHPAATDHTVRPLAVQRLRYTANSSSCSSGPHRSARSGCSARSDHRRRTTASRRRWKIGGERQATRSCPVRALRWARAHSPVLALLHRIPKSVGACVCARVCVCVCACACVCMHVRALPRSLLYTLSLLVFFPPPLPRFLPPAPERFSSIRSYVRTLLSERESSSEAVALLGTAEFKAPTVLAPTHAAPPHSSCPNAFCPPATPPGLRRGSGRSRAHRGCCWDGYLCRWPRRRWRDALAAEPSRADRNAAAPRRPPRGGHPQATWQKGARSTRAAHARHTRMRADGVCRVRVRVSLMRSRSPGRDCTCARRISDAMRWCGTIGPMGGLQQAQTGTNKHRALAFA